MRLCVNCYRKIKNGLVCIHCKNGNKCAKCGSKTQLTIDHIIPKSKGGSNRKENLQTLCYECNQKKADNLEAKIQEK